MLLFKIFKFKKIISLLHHNNNILYGNLCTVYKVNLFCVDTETFISHSLDSIFSSHVFTEYATKHSTIASLLTNYFHIIFGNTSFYNNYYEILTFCICSQAAQKSICIIQVISYVHNLLLYVKTSQIFKKLAITTTDIQLLFFSRLKKTCGNYYYFQNFTRNKR